jgi:hypothetical protein
MPTENTPQTGRNLKRYLIVVVIACACLAFLFYIPHIVWHQPHVGEVWVGHDDNPFEPDIRCVIVAVSNGWTAFQWIDDDGHPLHTTNSKPTFRFTRVLEKESK